MNTTSSAATILSRLRSRQPAFADEWERQDYDPGDAILGAFAQQLAVANERFDRLPSVLARSALGIAGVSLREPVPARVTVQFSCSASDALGQPTGGLVIPQGSEFGARLPDAPDPVGFRLEFDTPVVPANDLTTAFSTPRATAIIDSAPLMSGEGHVALLGQPVRVGNSFLIGLGGQISIPTLSFEFGFKDEPSNRNSDVLLVWEALTSNGFELVQCERDQTRGFSRTGCVVLAIPPSWRPLTLPGAPDVPARRWFRVRLANGGFRRTPILTSLRPNVGTMVAVRRVRDQIIEPVAAPGQPDARRFVLPGVSPATPVDVDSVILEVNDSAGNAAIDGGWVSWERVKSLDAVGPDVAAFVVDGSSGEIAFGDGRRGRSAPEGFRNMRVSFDLVAGASSMVASGQRFEPTRPPEGLTGAIAVSGSSGALNARPTDDPTQPASDRSLNAFGGATVRSQHRAVSLRDLEHLAPSAPGAAIDRAIAVRGVRVDGTMDARAVSVFVLRQRTGDDPRPLVGTASLSAIERYLDECGPPGLDVQVGIPNFVPIGVTALVRIGPRTEPGSVVAAVRSNLDAFLDPLMGRGGRWRVGDHLRYVDLVRAIASVPNVAAVEGVNVSVAGRPAANPCADVHFGQSQMPLTSSHLIQIAQATA